MQNTGLNLKVELEDLGKIKKKLVIEIPSETVAREFEGAYKNLKANASIAGFRKGTIPKNVLKAKFGDKVKSDVASRLIEVSYSSAVAEKNLKPVGNPNVELISKDLEEDLPFSYAATLEVQPELDITDYMGMELPALSDEVTDKEVEETLEKLRDAKGEYKEGSGPIKEKDLVNIAFEGSIGGEAIKSTKLDDYHIIIGENKVLPGFDEALKGASKGDVREAKVNFPENNPDKSVAGKEVVFRITVKGIKEKVMPNIDDEFAKDLNFPSLEDLKSRIKEEIHKGKKSNNKEAQKTAILSKLIEKHSFDVPEGLVNRYLSLILNRVADNMKKGVVAPQDRGLNAEQLRDKYKEVAIRQVREDVILDSIVAKEKVEVAEEEVQSVVKNLAASNNENYESLLARVRADGTLELLKDGIKHEKVLEKIIASSKAAS